MQFFTRLGVAVALSLLATLLLVQPVRAQKLRETKYERGTIDKGHKVGMWEYFGYTPSGERVIVQRFDHDANKLLYFRPGADVLYRVEVSPGKWNYVLPDQPPLFIGGDASLAAFTKQMVYPEVALARNIQGKVVVALVIDTLGHASDYKLLQRIGGGCDEEALRVARTVPTDQWIPARVGSHAVPVIYELPLNFRLQ